MEAKKIFKGIMSVDGWDREMSVNQLAALAETMDCEVVIRQKNSDDSWAITDNLGETDDISELPVKGHAPKMPYGEAIQSIMDQQSIKKIDMARMAGVSNATMLERLNRGNISVRVLNETLTLLGYKTVIMPEDVLPPENSYEIE